MNDFPTLEELKQMQEVDVSTVDKDTLVDISTVHVDESLPYDERMKEFVRQIKNPYCYLNNGVVVKVGLAGKEPLEECIARYIRSKG